MGFIKWLLVIACFGLNGQTALAEAQAVAPSPNSGQLEDNITELRQGLISVMAQNKIPVTHNAAVIKFNNVGEKVGELMIGETVTELLTSALVESKKLSIVDRANMKKIAAEMALGQSGLLDEGTTAEVGKIVGAKLMIGGSVMMAGQYFYIKSNLIDVETSKLLGTAGVKIDKKLLIEVASQLHDIKQHPIISGFKSLLIPGWGQIDNGKGRKGAVLLGLSAAAFISAYSFNQQANIQQRIYQNATDKNVQAEKDYRDELNSYTMFSLFAAGGISLYSFLDAVLGVARYNKSLREGDVAFTKKIRSIVLSYNNNTQSPTVGLAFTF